jgi:hypothetical protein
MRTFNIWTRPKKGHKDLGLKGHKRSRNIMHILRDIMQNTNEM